MSSLVLLLAAATVVAVVGVGLEAMDGVVGVVLVWEIGEGLLLKEEGGW